jgi:SSS family solute:Na+ symporter
VTTIDWIIVFALNGAVILYGFYLARGTHSSNEWFLGKRALAWWAIGISMFATNVDNFDIVSNVGYTYKNGINMLSVHTLGLSIGGILAAFFVIPAIYRAGCYTNSEFLEARFGPSTRAISVMIQLLYRTFVLGMMIWSVHLMLTGMIGLESGKSWTIVIMLVSLAAIYTAWGGLKTVVMTDALQSVILIVGTLVIFFVVWDVVGGWSGMMTTFEQMKLEDGGNATHLAHISQYDGSDDYSTSPYLVILAWAIMACGYFTVNHTQTMRLMGSRSIWDMKMAVIVGVGLSIPIMITVILLGLFGKALDPAGLSRPDALFPYLAGEYLTTGLRGLVVAGLVAAALSTFDSTGSALSAVFTRDIYARFIIRNKPDRHYVIVSRVATPLILALGFLYLPYIRSNETMMGAFKGMISVFVTPLLVVYVAGALTKANRRSGLIGLLCGSAYGLSAFFKREIGKEWVPEWFVPYHGKFKDMPDLFSDSWLAFPWSVCITSLVIAVVTICWREKARDQQVDPGKGNWLETSRQELTSVSEHPFERAPRFLKPEYFAILLLAVASWLVFGVFW